MGNQLSEVESDTLARVDVGRRVPSINSFKLLQPAISRTRSMISMKSSKNSPSEKRGISRNFRPLMKRAKTSKKKAHTINWNLKNRLRMDPDMFLPGLSSESQFTRKMGREKVTEILGRLQYSLRQVMTQPNEGSNRRTVRKDMFISIWVRVFAPESKDLKEELDKESLVLANEIYDYFDIPSKEVVDIAELCIGISVLFHVNVKKSVAGTLFSLFGAEEISRRQFAEILYFICRGDLKEFSKVQKFMTQFGLFCGREKTYSEYLCYTSLMEILKEESIPFDEFFAFFEKFLDPLSDLSMKDFLCANDTYNNISVVVEQGIKFNAATVETKTLKPLLDELEMFLSRGALVRFKHLIVAPPLEVITADAWNENGLQPGAGLSKSQFIEWFDEIKGLDERIENFRSQFSLKLARNIERWAKNNVSQRIDMEL